MQPVITEKKTYIAPFVNAEKPQYLVIEDNFPRWVVLLEKGFGVYMADRQTVNLSERMKVQPGTSTRHRPLAALARTVRPYAEYR